MGQVCDNYLGADLCSVGSVAQSSPGACPHSGAAIARSLCRFYVVDGRQPRARV